MSELTTKQTTSIAIPSEFQGFTESEALGGMNPVQESYRKSYKYFLSRPSTLGNFQIIDNETEQVVWEGDKIEGAVIYYAHEIMRLKRGHVESMGKSDRDFTDEENELVAITYDSFKSKGSFAGGYDQYLTNEYKDLHGKMKRLYIVLLLPKACGTGAEPVLASFSVTTNKTFNALRKSVQSLGVPMPLLRTNIFFSKAKSENNEDYLRIDFALAKNAEGQPVFTHKSREEYLSGSYGVKMLNEIIATHKGAVENAERSGFGGSIAVEAGSGSTFTEALKDSFKGTDVDPDDGMPF